MGDNVLTRAVDWVRGGLASAAGLVLDPLKSLIRNTVGRWGTVGALAGDMGANAIDKVLGWIRGKDDEAPTGVGSGGWVRPSAGPVTSRYGPRWGGFHAGIDIAGGGKTFAAAAGQVLKTGWNILAGRTGIGILLGHGGGSQTYYGHNPSMGALQVRPGQAVRAGQHIGYQGATGNVTGTHLHFELLEGGRAVNPEKLGVFDSGGDLLPGMLGMNQSRKPEVVLTNQVIADINAMANRAARIGGGEPQRIEVHATSDDLARKIARAIVTSQRDSVAASGLGGYIG